MIVPSELCVSGNLVAEKRGYKPERPIIPSVARAAYYYFLGERAMASLVIALILFCDRRRNVRVIGRNARLKGERKMGMPTRRTGQTDGGSKKELAGTELKYKAARNVSTERAFNGRARKVL